MNDRMSDMDALVEVAARAIRESVIIGPFGPNALETLTSGGSTFLTGGEADDTARAALLAVGLPALLERVEAAEGEVAPDSRQRYIIDHGGPGADAMRGNATPCPACINQRGEHIACDQESNHYGLAHSNREHEVIWSPVPTAVPDALAAKVARVEALADEWQRMVYDTRNPRGDTGSVRRCAEEVRAALDASETP